MNANMRKLPQGIENSSLQVAGRLRFPKCSYENVSQQLNSMPVCVTQKWVWRFSLSNDMGLFVEKLSSPKAQNLQRNKRADQVRVCLLIFYCSWEDPLLGKRWPLVTDWFSSAVLAIPWWWMDELKGMVETIGGAPKRSRWVFVACVSVSVCVYACVT